MPGKPLLNSPTYKLNEAVIHPDAFFQLCVELRSEHIEQLRIPGDKRQCGIGALEHQGVSNCAADHRTAEVALQSFDVRAWLHQLHSKGRDLLPGPLSCNRQNPGKAVFHEND